VINRKNLVSLMLLGSAVVIPAGANLLPITDLFSTGVGPGGPITGNDPYYTVVSSPPATCGPDGSGVCTPQNTTPQNTVVDLPNAFPVSPYYSPDTASSRWISLGPGNTLAGGAAYSEPAGLYIYQTTFTLPAGFQSATVSGTWAADNVPSQITLNGNAEASVGLLHGAAFTSTPDFDITSGFVAGTNTLDFYVINLPQLTGNPEALRVEFNANTGYVVPEPAFFGVLGLGLTGLAIAAVRHRRQA
jgi:hypothetical protein